MMGKGSPRCGRIGDLLHRELAKLISDEFGGPKFGMITVSGVAVSDDLSYARVYITVLQDDKETLCMTALNDSAVFFRTQMSKQLSLRAVPKLKFYFDSSLRSGTRMDELLDSVKDQTTDEDL